MEEKTTKPTNHLRDSIVNGFAYELRAIILSHRNEWGTEVIQRGIARAKAVNISEASDVKELADLLYTGTMGTNGPIGDMLAVHLPWFFAYLLDEEAVPENEIFEDGRSTIKYVLGIIEQVYAEHVTNHVRES